MSNGTQGAPSGGSTNFDDASADEFHIEHFDIKEEGITLGAELLEAFGLTPETRVTVMLCDGQVVITSQAHKRSLFKSAEELQMRQDETKKMHGYAIRSLLGIACAMPPSPPSVLIKR